MTVYHVHRHEAKKCPDCGQHRCPGCSDWCCETAQQQALAEDAAAFASIMGMVLEDDDLELGPGDMPTDVDGCLHLDTVDATTFEDTEQVSICTECGETIRTPLVETPSDPDDVAPW